MRHCFFVSFRRALLNEVSIQEAMEERSSDCRGSASCRAIAESVALFFFSGGQRRTKSERRIRKAFLRKSLPLAVSSPERRRARQSGCATRSGGPAPRRAWIAQRPFWGGGRGGGGRGREGGDVEVFSKRRESGRREAKPEEREREKRKRRRRRRRGALSPPSSPRNTRLALFSQSHRLFFFFLSLYPLSPAAAFADSRATPPEKERRRRLRTGERQTEKEEGQREREKRRSRRFLSFSFSTPLSLSSYAPPPGHRRAPARRRRPLPLPRPGRVGPGDESRTR